MTITEAKAKLPAVVDEVEQGEEIEITRHGRTVAKIIPVKPHHDLKGLFEGKVKINVPDEELYSTGVTWEAQ
jgi:prevent-host-death family protein